MKIPVFIGLFAASHVFAATNLITNSSFETGPSLSSSYLTLQTGDNSIAGWTVTAGSVDYIGSYWNSSDGSRSLDLAGNEPGAISQAITTKAGEEYKVTFDLAGNPDRQTDKILGIDIGIGAGVNALNRTFSFSQNTQTLQNMGWLQQSFSFVATGTSTTLRFAADPNSLAWGPALDNVSVIAIPAVAPTAPVAGVQLVSATATDSAYSNANRTADSLGVPATLSYKNLTITDGSRFELGSNETLNLDGGVGTLHIAKGSVFVANGTVNAVSVLNEGLLAVKPTQLEMVNNTHGGIIKVTASTPSSPQQPIVITPSASSGGTVVQQGTYLVIGGTGFGGTSGGGTSGTAHSNPGAAHYEIQAPVLASNGTTAWDGQLDVTGNFTQTSTGRLRMYIAGDKQGETYSFLSVGTDALLDGRIQVVLQPELFGSTPKEGEYFDLLHAAQGITLLDEKNFGVDAYMTAQGATRLGLLLPEFHSEFLQDPDQLVCLSSGLFGYQLVFDEDGIGQTLRVAMNKEVAIPEPSTAFFAIVPFVALFWKIRKANRRAIHQAF